MSAPPDPGGLPALPLTQEERERVVEVLTRHYAADRLGDADLEARLERVYRAATRAELQTALEGLPSLAPAAAEAPRVPAAPDEESATRRVEALLSGQEERVTGVVPRALRVRSRLGYVELDLTRATFEPGVTTLEVSAFMGYVEIRLPPGLRVESRGRAIAGFFAVRGASRAGGEDAPCTVRIRGRAVMGYAEVRVARGDAPRLRSGEDA